VSKDWCNYTSASPVALAACKAATSPLFFSKTL